MTKLELPDLINSSNFLLMYLSIYLFIYLFYLFYFIIYNFNL